MCTDNSQVGVAICPPFSHFLKFGKKPSCCSSVRAIFFLFPLCNNLPLSDSHIVHVFADIVTLGGLPLIMDLCNYYEDNIQMSISLANLLANISAYDNTLEVFHSSGEWVQIFFTMCSHTSTLLIEEDICDCRNISNKFPCVCVCLSSGNLFIFCKSFPFLFHFFYIVYFLHC